MIKTPAYKKCHLVMLTKPLPEDGSEVMAPLRVYAAIEPSQPGAFDEEKITHLVTVDYHPQITMNSRIVTEDDRELWVRGLQDIDFRHVELRLLCEEVPAR